MIKKHKTLIISSLGVAITLMMGCTRNGWYDRRAHGESPFSAAAEAFHHDHIAESATGDRFALTENNQWRKPTVAGEDASTFAIDVDTASYATLRAWIRNGHLPPIAAVRVEEMINYFNYDYAKPQDNAIDPIEINGILTPCPWNQRSQLLHVTVTGQEIHRSERTPSNLVFLIDVSGSMQGENRLGLIKRSFEYLTNQLTDKDRVAIIVYAGSSGMALESTPGNQRQRIKSAINNLHASGSTNGGAGIQLAYDTARRYFLPDGNNRVILATDGDFNMGLTNQEKLTNLIKKNSDLGVDLTILGVGKGDFKDDRLEGLSNNGDGNYFYLDSRQEARKVFGQQLTSSIQSIARDVKAQIFFNPAKVLRWRQIGYENRQIARHEFNDDRVDGGEVGAGHAITALYEIQSVADESASDNPFVQGPERPEYKSLESAAYAQLRLRYQDIKGGVSKLQSVDVNQGVKSPYHADDITWIGLIAAWGQLLREEASLESYGWAQLQREMSAYRGRDPMGYRAEAIELMEQSWHLPRRHRR